MNGSIDQPQKALDDEERLEARRRNALLPPSEDPLFKGYEVYDGPAPADLSERHDEYLYGDDEKS